MAVHIKKCNNCLSYLFPQFNSRLKLDHSSGHSTDGPAGLSNTTSVITVEWVNNKGR